jgi:hypothetical protein
MNQQIGVKLNTTHTFEQIVKLAKKGRYCLEVITPNNRSGFIKLRIKTNAHYSLLDIDLFTDGFSHDLTEQGKQVIEKALRANLLPVMKTQRVNDKLVVSKTFITTPTIKGQEVEILQLILTALETPSHFQSIWEKPYLQEFGNKAAAQFSE